jgi:hypothetical protein
MSTTPGKFYSDMNHVDAAAAGSDDGAAVSLRILQTTVAEAEGLLLYNISALKWSRGY